MALVSRGFEQGLERRLRVRDELMAARGVNHTFVVDANPARQIRARHEAARRIEPEQRVTFGRISCFDAGIRGSAAAQRSQRQHRGPENPLHADPGQSWNTTGSVGAGAGAAAAGGFAGAGLALATGSGGFVFSGLP